MDAGPRVEQGYDLALTEVLDGEHRFLVEAGSAAGAEVLAELSSRPADASRRGRGDGGHRFRRRPHGAHDGERATCATSSPTTSSIRAGTRWPSAASPAATARWSARPASARRSRTRPTSTGAETERTRVWDTCFSLDYSYIHGGSVRTSARSRYRQWLTHKLGTWHDQFDTSGCVGCGRCITWCPVGIDITEEVAALRGEEADDATPA